MNGPAATSHEEISSRDARTISHVLSASEAVAWPSEVDTSAQLFIQSLAEHDSAMTAGDLIRCQEASEAVHHAQDDFSEAVYDWLSLS